MNADKPFVALVVDDDPLVRGTTVRALRLAGFDCDSAGDGIEGIAKITHNQYDVAIVDLRMPELNGHAMIVEILPMENRPVIMVLTGVLEPVLARDLLLRGVDDVILKPANYDFLVVKVKTAVERRRSSLTALHAVEELVVGNDGITPPVVAVNTSFVGPESRMEDSDSNTNSIAENGGASTSLYPVQRPAEVVTEEVTHASSTDDSLSQFKLMLARMSEQLDTLLKVEHKMPLQLILIGVAAFFLGGFLGLLLGFSIA